MAVKIPASWSEQFYLSISNEYGYIETRPYRKFNDGNIVSMGDSKPAKDGDELMEHIMQFETGNLHKFWSYFDDDDDVCRNGKPIAECECC